MKALFGPLGLFILGFPIALLALVEFEIRRSGLGDRPLYRANSLIGYIPYPSQRGKFANSVDWSFNERSMRNAGPFRPDPSARDILLVGDSLVFGKHYELETPGPEMAKASGARVWPIAAPSWALANQLTYLEINPDIARDVDDIVFVVNSGDLGPASNWVNDFMHLRAKPHSYAFYWLGSQFLMGWGGSAIPVADRGPLADRLERLRGQTKARILFLYYPSKDELQTGEPCSFAPQELRKYPGYCLAQDPEWSVDFYEDEIHPRADASPLLGRAMARGLNAANQR